jgi:hypothetical protein
LEDFVEPTAGARGRVLALLAIALLAGLAMLASIPALREYLATLPPCDALRLSSDVLVGLMALGMLGGVPALREGFAVLQRRQWPLPGAKVWKRTPVLRGDAARRRGYLLLAIAVLVFATCGYAMWLARGFTSAASCSAA